LIRRQRLTFQGLAHQEGQETELQLAQQVTRLFAKVPLQDVIEQFMPGTYTQQTRLSKIE